MGLNAATGAETLITVSHPDGTVLLDAVFATDFNADQAMTEIQRKSLGTLDTHIDTVPGVWTISMTIPKVTAGIDVFNNRVELANRLREPKVFVVTKSEYHPTGGQRATTVWPACAITSIGHKPGRDAENTVTYQITCGVLAVTTIT